MRLLVSLLLAVLLAVGSATAPQVATAQSDPDIERRAGQGRLETAVAVALTDWPDGAETVLLATAGNFPDALAAAPLAASLDAPLLLTPSDALPDVVADALTTLEAQTVLVLGGQGAVSDRVVSQVQALDTEPEVERISGQGRFDTAAAVALRAGAPEGIAIVASGLGFADALAAGAASGTPARPPVLLVTEDAVPKATSDALQQLGVERVVLVGGQAAVGFEVEQALREAEYETIRLSGRDRFGTAAAVLRGLALFGEVPDRSRVVVATGTAFPDALTAGPLSARLGAALVLAAPDSLPYVVADEVALRRTSSAVLVGGRGALGQGAEDGVRTAFSDPRPITSAEGRTLTVDGDPVVVSNERWQTRSAFEDGTPPTFTLLGAAAGEVVDILVTEFDVRDTSDGSQMQPVINSASSTGISMERENRLRPVALAGDEERENTVAWANLRLAGCPCTVEMTAGDGFRGIFESWEVQGSFTIQAVRSDFARHPLVELPHTQEVTLTTPGQTGGFDAMLRRGDLVTLTVRDGKGFEGHFEDREPGNVLWARSTNLFGTRVAPGTMRTQTTAAEVKDEQSNLALVDVTDRYRFELLGTDWMTGQATVSATLAKLADEPLTDDPITVEVTEPGQAAVVTLEVTEPGEIPLELSWALDRGQIDCRYMGPADEGLRRFTDCASRRPDAEGRVTPTLNAEVAGTYRILMYSERTGSGTFTFALQ